MGAGAGVGNALRKERADDADVRARVRQRVGDGGGGSGDTILWRTEVRRPAWPEAKPSMLSPVWYGTQGAALGARARFPDHCPVLRGCVLPVGGG